MDIKVDKDEITIDKTSAIGKLIANHKGKIKIKTPFGEREITKVK